jgi:hypothetical protein
MNSQETKDRRARKSDKIEELQSSDRRAVGKSEDAR